MSHDGKSEKVSKGSNAEPEAGPRLGSERIFRGHTGAVRSVAVLRDGKRAISGSDDNTLKLWDIGSGKCLRTFEGHTDFVSSVAVLPDGERAMSGSWDSTLKLWDIDSGNCLSPFEGHTSRVYSVAALPDGERAISGSADGTPKIWDIGSGKCLSTFGGHAAGIVLTVAVLPDGKRAISGSGDNTLKLWDIGSGRCLSTFEGHTNFVYSVAVLPDGKQAISSSSDHTLKLWDIGSGKCLSTFEGHTNFVWSVALLQDGEGAISCSSDGTLRLWHLETGASVVLAKGEEPFYSVALLPDASGIIAGRENDVLFYPLLGLDEGEEEPSEPQARYTNAKVVLVGKTSAGKTGLAMRLCEDRWEPTESTHGMLVSQMKLPSGSGPRKMDHEVWLWDFAGQPDYRLIHQLYMDETALGVLVFDPQDDNPFEEIGHWEKALRRANKGQAPRLLVAGRCDRGGITISKKRFDEYCREHGMAGFLTTGAKTGDGCEELKAAIAEHIPWKDLPWTSTTQLFKSIKDAILQLKEEETPLVRLPELHRRLQLLLPDVTFSVEELLAVVGLMQGQGVVQKLAFGDFVLLHPEEINCYASVVVRMARENTDEIGVVPEQRVLDGDLEYKGMKRLAEADEKILLRAMAQTFLDRSLCLREHTPAGTMLVFPSYFRRDKPDKLEHPNVFVTYGFSGPLEEVYSTLVVRLSYSDDFKNDQLWKDAADFKTHGGKHVGLAMRDKGEGAAEIVVYFDGGVPDDTKVTFIKYVHEHLLGRAQDVTRVRSYVCPYCNSPVENRQAIKVRLDRGLTDIVCATCEERVPLMDLIEEKFGSDEFSRRVREMDETAKINIDNESRELILVGHAFAIAGEAGQIFRPTANSDWGIDGEIEFKDDNGNASGRRVYLQLKSGDSYLTERQRDEVEVFTIKNPRHADYWQQQAYPVYLVIRTSDGAIRWMNVTEYLKNRKDKDSKQIIFKGEPFTASTLLNLRERCLRGA